MKQKRSEVWLNEVENYTSEICATTLLGGVRMKSTVEALESFTEVDLNRLCKFWKSLWVNYGKAMLKPSSKRPKSGMSNSKH